MKQIVKNFNNLIKKTIFKLKNKTNNKFHVSTFNKYIITVISILFAYIFYLLIPLLYDKNWVQNKIVNKDEYFDFIIEDAGHYLKDQIISLFILFKKLKPEGIFIVEELDFPDIRNDMNVEKEKPTLREILYLIKENKEFYSKYINDSDKKYFLDNFEEISIFKGKFNEIAFIKKK